MIANLAVVSLHLLGATVWTGGHLVLCLTVLPRALRQRDPSIILDFERGFERLGIPALLVQILTGMWLAHGAVMAATETTRAHVLGLIGFKVLLLLVTGGLAIHARFRLLPDLRPERLRMLAVHIAAVTAIAVLFVLAGVALRT